MKHYEVSAFRYIAKFDDENKARADFERVKNNYTYCELKEVKQDSIAYQSHSLEIFLKR